MLAELKDGGERVESRPGDFDPAPSGREEKPQSRDPEAGGAEKPRPGSCADPWYSRGPDDRCGTRKCDDQADVEDSGSENLPGTSDDGV